MAQENGYQMLIDIGKTYSSEHITNVLNKWQSEDGLKKIQWMNACWHFKYMLKFFAQHISCSYDEDLMKNQVWIGLKVGYKFEDVGNRLVLEMIRLVKENPDKWLEYTSSTQSDTIYYIELYNRCK